jgi:hypothetical protein
MDSLAQTAGAKTATPLIERRRFVGWSTIVSGIALVIVGEKPYFPSSFGLFLLLASLALYLGMIPVALWLARSTAIRMEGSATSARVASFIGITGAVIASGTAMLALPHWLPVVTAQILDTSSLGIIGLWLLAANVLAFRARLINRVLAVLGVFAGVGLLLGAATMWGELIVGNVGSAVSTLETIRFLGGALGALFYLIWALWLGIWLLVRRKRLASRGN